MDDDLDGFVTPTQRFVARVRGPLAWLLALLLVVPLGAGLLQTWVFGRAGDRVVDAFTADDLDAALAESVLLIGATTCAGRSTTGTAFVAAIGGDVVVLTNRHVVEDAGSVGLRRLDGGPGPRVATWQPSRVADVAVVHLEEPEAAPAALVLRGGAPAVGTDVRTVGFPSGLPFTTAGPVAAVEGGTMLLDLAVDPGASGSPVLDHTAEVVGQVFARTPEGRGVGTTAATIVAALGDLEAPRSDCPS